MQTRKMSRLRGFTLIEMMIVVLIIAILSSIAFPSYRKYVMKTKRAECEGVLLTGAGIFERYYAANNSYQMSSGTPQGIKVLTCPRDDKDGKAPSYTVKVSSISTSGFTLQAIPYGGQAKDECGTLSINQTGTKTASGGTVTDVAVCWK